MMKSAIVAVSAAMLILGAAAEPATAATTGRP